MIEEMFPDMEEKEKIYLSLHLLGSRVAVSATDIFEMQPSQTVYEITKALVAEFEKISCVMFEDREALEHALFIHINSSLYRYQYGIQMGDDISEDIIREYPDLFEITKIASRYIEKQIGMPIPDGEIAYLALHFGAHLSIEKKDDATLRILIVCANGISTGNMLKREVQKMIPAARIVDVTAAASLQNAQKICDVIISTVALKCLVPVIKVHPILTEQDRKTILEHPKIKGKAALIGADQIFEIVKPFIDEKKQGKAKKALADYFSAMEEEKEEKKMVTSGSLLEMLPLSHIKIHEEEYRWMQSIQEAGKCLVENGSIDSKYLDAIISQIRYYGPYMFITPRVILAHAKPEEGVNFLDISLHIFKNSVEYSDFHKANIVIVLATKDQESHLKLLKDIVTIFSIQTRIDDLLQMENESQVQAYLRDILNNN